MAYMTQAMQRRRGRRVAMGGIPIVDQVLEAVDAVSTWASSDQPDPTDNVDQTVGGGTSTSAADFKMVGTACKPMNFPALAATRELQNQLNRVAQVKGFGKISADGAVGPSTLALFRQVQAVAAGSVMGDPGSCMGIAPDVDVLGAQVRAVADTLGAPATVSGALSLVPPTIVTKSNKVVAAPDPGIMGSLSSLSQIEKLALLAVAGGLGYMAFTRQKKRRA